MSVLNRRAEAVAETVAKIRAIENARGVSQEALAEIKTVLDRPRLAAELFPLEHFPIRQAPARSIVSRKIPDRRFALYASVGAPGKAQPPHNHTTWAVISGVRRRRAQCLLRAHRRSRHAGHRRDPRDRRADGAARQRLRPDARRFPHHRGHQRAVVASPPYVRHEPREPAGAHLFRGSTGGAYKVFPASPKS